MKGYLLDTTIFNFIMDGKISIEDLPMDAPRFVTQVQLREIYQTPNKDRQNQLLACFKELYENELPTETCIAGGSVGSRIGNGALHSKFLDELDNKKLRKTNANAHDALLAEVTLVNNLTLLTGDDFLYRLVISMNGAAIKYPRA